MEAILERSDRRPEFARTITRGFPFLLPGKKIVINWNRMDNVPFQFHSGGFSIVCRCRRHGGGLATNVAPVECILDFGSPVDREME